MTVPLWIFIAVLVGAATTVVLTAHNSYLNGFNAGYVDAWRERLNAIRQTTDNTIHGSSDSGYLGYRRENTTLD